MIDNSLKLINLKEAAKTAKVLGAFKPFGRGNKVTKTNSKKPKHETAWEKTRTNKKVFGTDQRRGSVFRKG